MTAIFAENRVYSEVNDFTYLYVDIAVSQVERDIQVVDAVWHTIIGIKRLKDCSMLNNPIKINRKDPERTDKGKKERQITLVNNEKGQEETFYALVAYRANIIAIKDT